MRRRPLIAMAVGTLLLAIVLAVVLVRTPNTLVAASRAAGSTKTAQSVAPSASAAAPATKAERNAAAIAAAAAPATAVTARLSIPSIGIRNAPVYDRGIDKKGVMQIAPGYAVTHYSFSAPFGSGNAVIYGHDDIQGNIFGHLYDLQPGDTVQVTVGAQTQVYRVTGHQIVAPEAIQVLAPTSDARLTIITCWPFNVDTKRWVVTAIRV
jgi:sortase A